MAHDPSRSFGAPTQGSFVDTHCHLDDPGFDRDLDEMLARSRRVGVERWVNVGFNPPRWHTTIELAARHRGMSHVLGVHPGDADGWTAYVASALRDTVAESNPVAIGEIGLDLFRGESNTVEQVDAFEAQLDIALDFRLPAVIHMRSAEREVIEILSRRSALPKLLFHSFDGSDALTDWILHHGALAGVGGLATRSKSRHIHHALQRLSLDRLVLETDAPYLVPNGFKHRRNTPESIPVIAAFVARLLNTDVDVVARTTTRNAESFFERLQPG